VAAAPRAAAKWRGRCGNRLGHPRDLHRVLTLEREAERRPEFGEVFVDLGSRCAGDRPADAVDGGKQQVDVVAANLEPSVAQGAEQIFRGVGGLEHLGQTHHAGRPLDGVRVAEQTGDQLTWSAVGFQLQEPCTERREAFVHLGAERREKFGVLRPCAHVRLLDMRGQILTETIARSAQSSAGPLCLRLY
jgi:hypothetical protein